MQHASQHRALAMREFLVVVLGGIAALVFAGSAAADDDVATSIHRAQAMKAPGDSAVHDLAHAARSAPVPSIESIPDFDLHRGGADDHGVIIDTVLAGRGGLQSVELSTERDFGLAFDGSYVAMGMLQDVPHGTVDAAPKGEADLAGRATNPVASLVQLQFQNTYVGESNAGSGGSNTFVVQPVIPWGKVGEASLLTRITFPLLVASPDLGDPIDREYGVGDTNMLNFATWNIKDDFWKGMWGPGAAFTFPTASSDFLGEGKFQAGPGLVYINLANPKLQWGAFAYQQWSFASAGGDGDRQEVSKIFFQPIITRHFEGGWYIALQDILWSYDFNNEKWSFPTGFRFGRVTKFGDQPVNLFVMPFYDLSGNNPGNEWGIKFNLTLLFPK